MASAANSSFAELIYESAHVRRYSPSHPNAPTPTYPAHAHSAAAADLSDYGEAIFTFTAVGDVVPLTMRSHVRFPLPHYLASADQDGLDAAFAPGSRCGAALLDMGMAICALVLMGFAPPIVSVNAGPLDDAALDHWQEHFIGVCAEFFFLRALADGIDPASVDPADCIRVQRGDATSAVDVAPYAPPSPPSPPSLRKQQQQQQQQRRRRRQIIVPLGGGKDSLVAFHLLAQALPESPITWLYVGDGYGEYGESWRLAHIVGATTPHSPPLVIEGEFLDEVWTQGALYDPDTLPWSMIVAHTAAFAAVLADAESTVIAVGNERSANEGNGLFLGPLEVNHQYDKAAAFEAATRAYIQSRLGPEILYTSVLAPLWETQIMGLFAELVPPLLWKVFISCNSPDFETRWCSACEKCLFVFLLASAFLGPTHAWDIFGDNLLARPDLADPFAALLGLAESKPFECVGTPDEVLVAAARTAAAYAAANLPLPLLLREYAHLWTGPDPSAHVALLEARLVRDDYAAPIAGLPDLDRVVSTLASSLSLTCPVP